MSNIQFQVPMVINADHGGYGLSRAASVEVARRKGLPTREEGGGLFVGAGWETVASTVRRDDPDLVAVVREMGAAAGRDLKVVEVTVCIDIEDHDGRETVRVSGGA